MGAAGSSLLQLTVHGIDRAGEVGKCVVSAADSKLPRRLMMHEGIERDYSLNLTLLVDHAPGSLWRAVFDSNGTWVPIVYRPYGNATPTQEQPHYEATALVLLPTGDLMGTTADKNRRRRQTIDVSWPLTGKPEQVPSSDPWAA